jgi:O-antigen/teichoic acid export membrane protein
MDKVNKIRKFFKKIEDLSAVGAANILGTAISAIFWLYLASVIETEQYGEISYLLAIASIGSIVAFVGGGGTIIVYVAKKIPIQPAVFVISLISSFAVATSVYLMFYSYATSLFIIGYVIFGLGTTHLLGNKFYKNYSKYFIIQRISFVGLAVVFYYLIGPEGVVLGAALSYFPPIIKVIKVFRETKLDFTILRPRLGFMINNYAKDLIRVLSSETDKLVIAPIFGLAILGNYYLGIQFLSLLSLIPSIVFQYVLAQDASGVSTTKLKKITIITSIIIAILGITIAPTILPMIYPKFENSGEIVQIMSVAIVPRTISLMLVSKFLGFEKSKFVLIGSGIYLVVQIPLIFLLGEIMSVNGIALALVIGEICLTVFLVIVNRFFNYSSTNSNQIQNN